MDRISIFSFFCMETRWNMQSTKMQKRITSKVCFLNWLITFKSKGFLGHVCNFQSWWIGPDRTDSGGKMGEDEPMCLLAIQPWMMRHRHSTADVVGSGKRISCECRWGHTPIFQKITKKPDSHTCSSKKGQGRLMVSPHTQMYFCHHPTTQNDDKDSFSCSCAACVTVLSTAVHIITPHRSSAFLSK